MQLSTHTGSPLSAPVDMIVLLAGSETPFADATFAAADAALRGLLKTSAAEQEWKGKSGQRLVLHTHGKLRARRIVLFGLGAVGERDAAAWVTAGAEGVKVGNAHGAKTLLFVGLGLDSESAPLTAAALARGACLGAYRFTEYKSEPGRAPTLGKVLVQCEASAARSVSAACGHAQIVAESVALARDLANRSPLQLYPETLADEAVRQARKYGLGARVLEPAELKRRKMGLLLGVGSGSVRTPRLVHLWTKPTSGGKQPPIALVGKGITFDSGGLSLKTNEGMLDMKIDMHGSATVLATLVALARLGVRRPVHGILALAENMPSGTAIRPGDVIGSASGKTVEITNTDAEGRLVLADALHYALGLEPARIIDVATLTGACMVALGVHTTGLFSSDDALADDLLAAARRAGEDVWRLPLTAALKPQLKSEVADLKNTGDRYGGAIIAALFLREFVGTTPWAHLDIAGPAVAGKSDGALAKGGTGVAVSTLVELLTAPPSKNGDVARARPKNRKPSSRKKAGAIRRPSKEL